MKFEELYRARTDALDVPELDADELRRKAAENAGDAHRAVLPAAPKRGFKIKYAAFAATAAVLVLSVSLVIYTMNGRGGGDTPSDILANETASSPAATVTPPVTESVPADPDTSRDTADAPQTGDESQTKTQPDTKDTADTAAPPSPTKAVPILISTSRLSGFARIWIISDSPRARNSTGRKASVLSRTPTGRPALLRKNQNTTSQSRAKHRLRMPMCLSA